MTSPPIFIPRPRSLSQQRSFFCTPVLPDEIFAPTLIHQFVRGQPNADLRLTFSVSRQGSALFILEISKISHMYQSVYFYFQKALIPGPRCLARLQRNNSPPQEDWSGIALRGRHPFCRVPHHIRIEVFSPSTIRPSIRCNRCIFLAHQRHTQTFLLWNLFIEVSTRECCVRLLTDPLNSEQMIIVTTTNLFLGIPPISNNILVREFLGRLRCLEKCPQFLGFVVG